jgi:hypothetical protein
MCITSFAGRPQAYQNNGSRQQEHFHYRQITDYDAFRSGRSLPALDLGIASFGLVKRIAHAAVRWERRHGLQEPQPSWLAVDHLLADAPDAGFTVDHSVVVSDQLRGSSPSTRGLYARLAQQQHELARLLLCRYAGGLFAWRPVWSFAHLKQRRLQTACSAWPGLMSRYAVSLTADRLPFSP